MNLTELLHELADFSASIRWLFAEIHVRDQRYIPDEFCVGTDFVEVTSPDRDDLARIKHVPGDV